MTHPEVLENGGRRCVRCRKVRDTFEFRFAPTGYQGLSDWCATCIEATKPKAPKSRLPRWVTRG